MPTTTVFSPWNESANMARKSYWSAKKSNRHVLYQLSVQNVEQEEEFLSETFMKLRGRQALTLREDFCGTALSAAEWVKKDKKRTAVGYDLDTEVLAYGQEHNIDPLGEDAKRVSLEEKNVVSVSRKKFDICAAMNFSYFIFKKRKELLKYFECVLKSLADDGIFVLDIYGGSEAQVVLEERRAIEEGFTYVWDQAAYNPIDNTVLNHIHFEFAKGPKMSRAFTYDWRLWTPQEVVEALEEVGFKDATVYWELEDDDGEETGVYEPAKVVENQEGWLAYIVGSK